MAISYSRVQKPSCADSGPIGPYSFGNVVEHIDERQLRGQVGILHIFDELGFIGGALEHLSRNRKQWTQDLDNF
ncbi:hypothetical protein GCM10022239_08640 [Leifsonia bigeumensis]|uniref:Uncharacterized protein n=1 Tax=Leifsonella bigeumensis TaxID=433643 RepID=A0ABP7FAM7_9MICO